MDAARWMAMLGLGLWIAAGAPVRAEELRIAMKGEVDNADPHQSYTPNRMVQLHVYETLLTQDEHLRPHPGLAPSWRALDSTTWEFALQPGVRFHDGSPLTPSDGAVSIMRAKSATGVRTYAAAVRNVISVEPTGLLTFLRIGAGRRGGGGSGLALDAKLAAADGTFDDGERERLTQEAVRHARAQRDVLPRAGE